MAKKVPAATGAGVKGLKQNMKKVWERRSHAFPTHYTPALLIMYCYTKQC